MDQGRGFSIPLENGDTQNGSKWIPSTPDKPVLQRSNNSQSEIHQNQIGGETWQDLMDVYEDYLRNKQPHSFDLNSSKGLIYTKHNHESVPPVENYSRLQHDLTSTGIMGFNRNVQNSQDVAPAEAYNRLPFNFNPNGYIGANNLEHNTQNVSILQKFRSLNQNAGRIGSYVQNLGEVVPSHNMNSLSEFRGIMNDNRARSSKGSPDISTIFMAKPIFPSPVSQVGNTQVADTSVGMKVQKNHIWHERSQVAHATVGARFPQRHAFHVNNDVWRYNQEGRPSFAKYNLNLTPRSEAWESSSASRSTLLTPDQQKQLKTCWITQVPHLLIDDNSDPEYIQECVVLPLEPEILEKDHCDILTNSMATSNAAFSTSPKDMMSSDGGNVEIDLNKTPQQKPPKRSKHRPKVIVEGKPKRSPKPSSAKSTNPDGTPPAKRKYVRRNDTKTSTPPTTEKVEVVKASQVIVEGKPKGSPKPSSVQSNTPDGTPLAKKKYVRRNDTKTSTPPTTEKVEVFKASQVIVEGEPKGSPKPSSAQSNTPGGTPLAKRKYVRRNDTKTSTPPTTEKVEVFKASQVIVEGEPKGSPKPSSAQSNTPDVTPLAKRKYVRRNDTKTSTPPTTEKVEVFKASQVIVDGEPKRSPRPSSSKSSNPDGTSSAKRKYVRRNDSKTSTPPITEKVKVVRASQLGLATKSCKRKLNFDMENDGENGVEKEGEGKGLDYQEPENEWSKLPLDLNLNFLDAEWSRELNGPPSTSAAKLDHHNTYGEEKHQSCSFFRSTISHQESMPPATVVVTPTSRDHTLNAIARSVNARNATVHHGESRYNQVHNPINRHLVFQENPCAQNMGFRAEPLTPHVLEDLVDVTDAQGTMPPYTYPKITNPRSITLMGSQLWSHGAPAAGLCNRDSSSVWLNGSETCKKKNVEDTMHGTSSSMSSGIRNIEEFIQQISNRMILNLPAQSTTLFQKGESSSSGCGRQATKQYANGSSVNGTCKQYINCTDIGDKFQQLHSSSQVHLYSENVVPKASHDTAVAQITKSLTTVRNINLESAPNRNPHSIAVNRNVSSLCAAVKKQTAGVAKCKKMPVSDKVLQQEPEKKRIFGDSSKKVAEIRVEKGDRVSIDDITEGMKNLHITDSDKESVLKEQSALVPYKGDSAVVPYKGDGAVVPYAESDLVIRRNPRPRVDLDPETNRLWNLLMGKEGGESAETMDTNKEKWWEEERKVFRGRIDAFIARMHLVQGDRRFSKWKGSVVDSVIGVFLTQNVSDHLSSSAFMSLAAKFPLKSATAREPYCEKGGSPSAGNQDVHVTYPDGTTFRQKMVKEPSDGHSSVTTTETSKHRADYVTPVKEASLIYSSLRRTEEDIFSSQSSSEYFIFQTSDSEAEVGFSTNPGLVSVSEQAERNGALHQYQFQLKGSSYQDTTPLINHQQFGKSADWQNPWWADFSNANSYPFISGVQHHQSSVLSSTNSWPDTLVGMQNCEHNRLALLGTENISTLASKIALGKGAQCMDHYEENAESAFMVSQDGGPKFQKSSLNHAVPNKSFELLTGSLDEFHYRNDQHLIKGMNEKQHAFDWEGSISRDPRRPAEAFDKQPSDNGECIEVETKKARGQSSDKHSSKTNTTPSKAKKQKAEKKKAEQFNWDTLRKQVQSKIGTTARSREATDSLDYEALRNADVREISDTIKERGMNNMLAERIKNFLNRVVQDHERIDLEWLRDVEPDKSKDYLLSILGLGLKSVECVRLLTLRHLAFPVDTNVGRIAVRLGWVPLQPLPESLQLHLLELYPILETIQKYLWPRLCKLDQETLYELHYQMITFGKVFCTKREPNCNACPMRADCRHFASAFASARLALPGPQERHIVTSAAPIIGKNSSNAIVKPMPLPPSKGTVEQGVRLSRDCEPVIEEPTTPEPPIEVEERDIEDAFYEDPDEIPVIKLNLEEFTTNLQSFIQEQIQTGEGDMSRALVALNPKFASIPSPKLKRTSRLRTEHLVYQLPDSHPLLKGMDRREPDDPSPYLLAIWTPGETADSVQAQESKCNAAEGGGMCHKETCFSCNTTREAETQTVRGTILIPCRTAMRGSFPLNGTYFQVNEVFADHESSLNPIDVPRSLLWNLPRRTVFFGSSVSSIFKGLSTVEIQLCFWKGFVCVRGFEQKTRAPRPLKARLHLTASRTTKRNEETDSKAAGKAKRNDETESKPAGKAKRNEETKSKAAGKAKRNEETESKAAGKAKRNEETESKAAGKAKRNEETESKAAGKAKRNEETESKAAGKAKRKTSRL